MALQDHAVPFLLINGNPLEDWMNVEFTTNSGQQRVDTVTKGLAGFTPGPGDVTISITYTIPIGGTEFGYQEACAEGFYVTAQYGRANKDYVGTGKITTNTESMGVGASMEGRIEWVGELKAYK